MSKSRYRYKAWVTRVIDGDSMEVKVDLGFFLSIDIHVRLAGVDTPERFTPEGVTAKEYVKERIEGKEISLRSDKMGKFGRWLGTIWIDGVCLNNELIDKGMAVVYSGGKRK